MHFNKQLKEKTLESMASVLPITAIVLILSITVAPLEPGTLVLFLFGAVLLIVGMGFFTLGVDISMIPMGEGIGLEISRSKRLLVPVLVYFVLGLLSTVAEPDLTVLANQVPAIPNSTLILTVGVGAFLVLAALRVRFSVPLRTLLLGFYAVVFLLAALAPDNFIPVSFDSGGVASGPMTATFLLPFAMGACQALGGNLMTDAFGIVAMVAMTPLVTIQLMGISDQLRHRLRRRQLRVHLEQVEDSVVYFD